MLDGRQLGAFASFGTFAVAAAGAIAKFYGFAPSQPDLAIFGFFGGVVGAIYAAIFERHSAGDSGRRH